MSEREELLARDANLELGRKLNPVVWVVTALVWILVGLMRRPDLKIPLPEGVDLGFLPLVNAGLNSCVAVLLVLALLAVKAGRGFVHSHSV